MTEIALADAYLDVPDELVPLSYVRLQTSHGDRPLTVKEFNDLARRRGADLTKHYAPTHQTGSTQKPHGNWAHPGYSDRVDPKTGDVTVTPRPGTKPHTQTALFHPDLFEQTPPDIPKPPPPKTLPPEITHPFTKRKPYSQAMASLLTDDDGNITREARFVSGEKFPGESTVYYGITPPSDWSQVAPEVALTELQAMNAYYMELHEVSLELTRQRSTGTDLASTATVNMKFLNQEIAGLFAEMDEAAKRALPALIARGDPVRQEVNAAIEKTLSSRAENLASVPGDVSESSIRWAGVKEFRQWFAEDERVKPLLAEYDKLEAKKQEAQATIVVLREIRGGLWTSTDAVRPIGPPVRSWGEDVGDQRILVPRSLLKQSRYGSVTLGNRKTDQLIEFHGRLLAGEVKLVPGSHRIDDFEGYFALQRGAYSGLFWDAQKRSDNSLFRWDKDQRVLIHEMRAAANKSLGSPREAALGVLSKHRSFGGSLDLNTGKGADALRANQKFIPSDWIARSNAIGKLNIDGTNRRGHYQHFDLGGKGWVSTMRIGTNPNNDVVLHEFGHRMEAINPMVLSLERAFYDYRTRGENPTPLKEFQGYERYRNSREQTRPDKWLNLYKGKWYGVRGHFRTHVSTRQVSHTEAYELLSMGFHEAFSQKFDVTDTPYSYVPPSRVGTARRPGEPAHIEDGGSDPEFKNFIYGLLLEA